MRWLKDSLKKQNITLDNANSFLSIVLEQDQARPAGFTPLTLNVEMYKQLQLPRSATLLDRDNQEFTLALERFCIESAQYLGLTDQKIKVGLLKRGNHQDLKIFTVNPTQTEGEANALLISRS